MPVDTITSIPVERGWWCYHGHLSSAGQRLGLSAAAERFATAVKKQNANVGGAYVGVPFVTLYSRDRVLSETARFNDAVVRCDTNQDGVITEAEAVVFAHHVE